MHALNLTFLGTSAGVPTRERNVSALALTYAGRVFLFDCGEGTQQQFLRSPVRSGAIEAIFITHLHGDHLYGLPGLLASLGLNGREAPLTVCGPPGIHAYLAAIPYRGTPYPIHVAEVDGEGEIVRGRGFAVRSALLEHSVTCLGFAFVEDERPGVFDVTRARALGVAEGPMFGRLQRGETIELPDGLVVRSDEVVGPRRRGRRVVYCTDTRPCRPAVELAAGTDVLIHEATSGNDYAQEAVERLHATAAEAASVARDAGARKLILTHFSARYRDVTPLLDEARAIFPETVAASDFEEFPVTAPD
jgi:ribonuclease Z